MKMGKSFWEMLLATKYLFVLIVAFIGIVAIWTNKLNIKLRVTLILITFILFGVI